MGFRAAASAPPTDGDPDMPTLQHSDPARARHEAPADSPLASFEALARCIDEWACDRPSAAAALLWRRSAEAALIARRAGACDALITAALWHRLGDFALAAGAGRSAAPQAAAAPQVGADLLSDLYPPLVTETIRLQTSAHRYLATGNAVSLGQLAFADSGRRGWAPRPMSEAERVGFASVPFAMNAIRLCRWTLAATGDAVAAGELQMLYRIAERSVCNDGFGWGG